MRGDATNFTHWDEVALSWKFVDTISEVWENTKEQIFQTMPLAPLDHKQQMIY